jgi:hypothetical protein
LIPNIIKWMSTYKNINVEVTDVRHVAMEKFIPTGRYELKTYLFGGN